VFLRGVWQPLPHYTRPKLSSTWTEKQSSYVVNLPVTTSTYVLLMDTLLHIQNSLQKNKTSINAKKLNASKRTDLALLWL